MRSFLHLNVRNLRPSLESVVSYKKNKSVHVMMKNSLIPMIALKTVPDENGDNPSISEIQVHDDFKDIITHDIYVFLRDWDKKLSGTLKQQLLPTLCKSHSRISGMMTVIIRFIDSFSWRIFFCSCIQMIQTLYCAIYWLKKE